ncbi:MAG: hypothetical protein PVSMB1_17160 [Gemmatimonadaceae bacterium]
MRNTSPNKADKRRLPAYEELGEPSSLFDLARDKRYDSIESDAAHWCVGEHTEMVRRVTFDSEKFAS